MSPKSSCLKLSLSLLHHGGLRSAVRGAAGLVCAPTISCLPSNRPSRLSTATKHFRFAKIHTSPSLPSPFPLCAKFVSSPGAHVEVGQTFHSRVWRPTFASQRTPRFYQDQHHQLHEPLPQGNLLFLSVHTPVRACFLDSTPPSNAPWTLMQSLRGLSHLVWASNLRDLHAESFADYHSQMLRCAQMRKRS